MSFETDVSIICQNLTRSFAGVLVLHCLIQTGVALQRAILHHVRVPSLTIYRDTDCIKLVRRGFLTCLQELLLGGPFEHLTLKSFKKIFTINYVD